MKKITFITMLLMAALFSASFTSCGEDTTIGGLIDTALHPVKINVEKGNPMIGTASALGLFTYTITAEFDDEGKCSKCTGSLDCKGKLIADGFEKVLGKGTRIDNTIIYDYTSKVNGYSTDQVLNYFNSLLEKVKSIAENL